jgi:murein DD-endopeptidase MepM/ murein hydrolase activator NlpD
VPSLSNANPSAASGTTPSSPSPTAAPVPSPSPSKDKPRGGQGGISLQAPRNIDEVKASIDAVEALTGQRMDLLALAESRLFEQRMRRYLLPTEKPVQEGSLGSAFGWRSDPFTGRSALHTGLDFQADPGTPILAAAGGIVVAQEWHNAYGNLVEIDHGNDLVTRYAHASRVHVQRGDVVKRGQKIAEVGSTGRSTGPHLHFEVLVQGVPQDPAKFLAASPAGGQFAQRGSAVGPAARAQTPQPVQLKPGELPSRQGAVKLN